MNCNIYALLGNIDDHYNLRPILEELLERIIELENEVVELKKLTNKE